jgi:hypothetical protein
VKKLFVLAAMLCLSMLMPSLSQAQYVPRDYSLKVKVEIPSGLLSSGAVVGLFEDTPETEAYYNCLIQTGHAKNCRMPASRWLNYSVSVAFPAQFAYIPAGRYLLVGDLVGEDITRVGWYKVPDYGDEVTISFGN